MTNYELTCDYVNMIVREQAMLLQREDPTLDPEEAEGIAIELMTHVEPLPDTKE